jgi:type IV pilus assembly protein PilW
MKIVVKLKKQKGSFLIELMVGLLMSALSVLGIMTIYAEFEGQKRTSTQMTDTMSNAAIGLFALEHETKNAGYGINSSVLLGCNIHAYKSGSGEFTFTMAPVKITPGANDKTPDQIAFFVGDSDSYFSPISITKGMPNSASALKVNSRFGFMEGNLMVVGQSGSDCTLMQVSNLPGSGSTDQIIHNPGSYTDPVTGQQMPAQYNKAGGLGITYGAGASVVNLGAIPSNVGYTITNNNLTRTESLINSNTATIANNIVMFKAIYMLDNNKDGIIDEWTNRTLAGPEYLNLKAVRLAIIAQSPLREKSKNGVCSTSTNSQFTWLGGTMDVSNIPNWKCYRYRKLETTVPIRNLLWSAS